MPTHNRDRALTLEPALLHAGRRAFDPPGHRDRRGGIGLEPESFPIYVDELGGPRGRVRLHDEERGVLAILDRAVEESSRINRRHRPAAPCPWEFALARGGRLTFEPGAQVEYSTAVRGSVAEVLSDIRSVAALLATAFKAHGAVLAHAGLDLWHHLDSVPQQLDCGRYIAQSAFYARRGPWGGMMMRHTASLQLNLDLGPQGVWQERWLLANLLAPLITATFAASPAEGVVSLRTRAWQQLDPSRTGFPALLVAGEENEPRRQWAEAALDADVMMFRLSHEVHEAGEPGYSFRRWMSEGHSRFGWPTADDLDYHLTTLFFEVRPRGFFELRGCEALPEPWRAAPVVLITALLYDERARQESIAALAEWQPQLPELWQRAARVGLADPALAQQADQVWQLALAGVGRLTESYFGSSAVTAANRFLEHFTARRRSPSDELRQLLLESPARALQWACGGSEMVAPVG